MFLSCETRSSVSIAAACLMAAALLAACSGPRWLANVWDGVASRPDKLAMVGLLKRRNYAALEKRLNDLQARFEAGKVSEDYLKTAFAAFAYSDPGVKQWLDEWVAKYPKSFAARLARGRYYAHLGWVARGEWAASDTSAARFQQMAQFHHVALRDFYEALKFNSHLPSAYCELIAIYAGYGRMGQTRSTFASAEKAVPSANCHISYLAWYTVPKWNGRDDSALAEVLRAARKRSVRDPRYKILEGFGEFIAAGRLFRSSHYKEAAVLYDKAVGLNPRVVYIRDRGRNHLHLRQFDKALADFQRALKLSPQNAKTLAALAEFYLLRGDFEHALDYANRALLLDPYAPNYLTLRLKIRRIGRIAAKSAQDFQDVMVFGADDPAVQNERAEYLESFYKEPMKAIRARKRAVELAPDISDYRRRYWKALVAAKDCNSVPAAVDYLRLCLRKKECDNKSIVSVSSLTTTATTGGKCPYKKQYVALSLRDRLSKEQLARVLSYAAMPDPSNFPDFVGETRLDEVTLEGLRPGMSIEEVTRLFPDMKLGFRVHPRTHRPLPVNGMVRRENGQWRIAMRFTPLGELQTIDFQRTFRSVKKPETIKQETIAKFGKPNLVVPGPIIVLAYREGGGPRDFDAALYIQIERLPEGFKAPPGKGEALRVTKMLTDKRLEKKGMKAAHPAR